MQFTSSTSVRHARAFTRREFLGSLALSAATLSCARPAQEASRQLPHIVLYLADTFRADGLGCYGNPVAASPAIDALARGGVLFERCYAHASWTKPSIASLFTGTVPLVHQATKSSWKMDKLMEQRVQILRPEFLTLAEALAGAGYMTAHFLTNPHVQREFGFAQGFEHYRYETSKTPTHLAEKTADWLRTQPLDKPIFLMVHEIDPHAPFTPDPGDFQALHHTTIDAARNTLSEIDRSLIHEYHASMGAYGDDRPERPDLNALSKDGVAFLRQLYDAEIRRVDNQFRILRESFAADTTRPTTFVFTSDHGEGFGEHGGFEHGHCLHDELLHVPLIVYTGQHPQSVRVPYSVGHVDLYATLLHLAGVQPPPYAAGAPLLGVAGDVTIHEDRAVFSCLDHYDADTTVWDFAVSYGPFRAMTLNRGTEFALFDKRTDPGETNVLETLDTPIDLEDTLTQTKARCETTAREFGPPQWTTNDEEFREELENLGYL